MARSIQQIFDEIVAEGKKLAATNNNTEVSDMLNNTSQAAVWKIIFYTMAFAVWTMEVLYDKFTASVDDKIATLVPHSLRWYRAKALMFQYGFDLLPDSDQFDNGTATAQQIEDSRIVKYAAVNETTVDGRRVLLIKIAREVSGQLTQLSPEQEEAFEGYMQLVKDAGNKLIIYNRLADLLRSVVDVYYNPLLLDGEGNRLDGQGGQPIVLAAESYLRNLDFNGEFSIAAFTDTLQDAYGVSKVNVFVKNFERKTGDTTWQGVNNTFIPDAGYTKFDTNGLTVNYIPHVPS